MNVAPWLASLQAVAKRHILLAKPPLVNPPVLSLPILLGYVLVHRASTCKTAFYSFVLSDILLSLIVDFIFPDRISYVSYVMTCYVVILPNLIFCDIIFQYNGLYRITLYCVITFCGFRYDLT